MRRLRAKTRASVLQREQEVLAQNKEELDADQVRHVANEMSSAREEVAAHEDKPSEFLVEPRGGPWLQRTTGQAVDRYRARAVTGAISEQFVKRFWKKGTWTMSFPLRVRDVEVCDHPTAVALGMTWCRMMQVWCDEWVAQNLPDEMEFSILEPDTFASPWLVALVRELPPGSALLKYYHALAANKPRAL